MQSPALYNDHSFEARKRTMQTSGMYSRNIKASRITSKAQFLRPTKTSDVVFYGFTKVDFGLVASSHGVQSTDEPTDKEMEVASNLAYLLSEKS
jgi:hypothetical protein